MKTDSVRAAVRVALACSAGLIAMSLPAAVLAQTEPFDDDVLEEITVTGRGETRTSATISASSIETEIVGISPLAVLKELPGVNVQTSDPFGLYELNNRLRIRGFDIGQIGLALDGMPFMGNKDEGSVITRLVLSENLDSVQVSPGAGDVTQPAMSALGGAIRYVSADPKRELGGSVSGTVGKYDMSRVFGRVDTGDIAGTGIYGYVSGARGQVGQWENRRYPNRADRFESKFLKEFGEQTIGYVFRWAYGSDHDTQNVTDEFEPNYLDAGQLNSMVTGNPARDGVWIGYWRNDYNTRVHQLLGRFKLADGVSLEVTPFYHNNFTRIFWGLPPSTGLSAYNNAIAAVPGRTDVTVPNGLPVQRDGRRTLDRLGVTTHLKWEAGMNTVEVGGWLENHDYRNYQPLNNTDPQTGLMIRLPVIAFENDYKVKTDIVSFYAKDTVKLFDDRLALALGAKALDTKRNLSGIANNRDFNLQQRRDETSTGKDMFQPQAGITFDATRGIELFANYAEAFGSVPSAGLASLIYNPDLKPESSKNTDIGVRFEGSNWSGFLSGFHVKYTDRILSFSGASRGGVAGTTYLNANGAKTKGVEALGEYKPAPGWRLFASLSYIDSKFVGDYYEFDGAGALTVLRAVDGNRLPDQPKVIGSASVSWSGPEWSWSIDGQYMGERWVNGGNSISNPAYAAVGIGPKVDAYELFNASLSWKAPPDSNLDGVRFQLAVYNLLDKKYISSLTPNATFGAGTRKQGYPRAPYFNISYTF
jgi:iron complex outermembrane recepter protein